MKKTLIIICAILALAACKKEEPGYFTNGVSDISYFKAVLHGCVNVDVSKYQAANPCFYYSKTESTPAAIREKGTRINAQFGQNGTFEGATLRLSYGTRYNFIACGTFKGTEYISDVASFSTTDIIAGISAEADNVYYSKASVSGRLVSEGDFSKSAWLYYGKQADAEALKASGTKVQLQLDEDCTFCYALSDLDYGTTYHFLAEAKVYDKTFSDELRSFTTRSTAAEGPAGTVALALVAQESDGSEHEVFWTACNLGASSPEEYGTLFTATEAATQSLTNALRLPTKAEQDALRLNCLWTWKGNGYEVTGSNGNSIFLPAAGYFKDGQTWLRDRGGYYWSGSASSEKDGCSYHIFFNEETVDYDYYDNTTKFSVRLVSVL